MFRDLLRGMTRTLGLEEDPEGTPAPAGALLANAPLDRVRGLVPGASRVDLIRLLQEALPPEAGVERAALLEARIEPGRGPAVRVRVRLGVTRRERFHTWTLEETWRLVLEEQGGGLKVGTRTLLERREVGPAAVSERHARSQVHAGVPRDPVALEEARARLGAPLDDHALGREAARLHRATRAAFAARDPAALPGELPAAVRAHEEFWIHAYELAGLRRELPGDAEVEAELTRLEVDATHELATFTVARFGVDATLDEDGTLVWGNLETRRACEEHWTFVRDRDDPAAARLLVVESEAFYPRTVGRNLLGGISDGNEEVARLGALDRRPPPFLAFGWVDLAETHPGTTPGVVLDAAARTWEAFHRARAGGSLSECEATPEMRERVAAGDVATLGAARPDAVGGFCLDALRVVDLAQAAQDGSQLLRLRVEGALQEERAGGSRVEDLEEILTLRLAAGTPPLLHAVQTRARAPRRHRSLWEGARAGDQEPQAPARDLPGRLEALAALAPALAGPALEAALRDLVPAVHAAHAAGDLAALEGRVVPRVLATWARWLTDARARGLATILDELEVTAVEPVHAVPLGDEPAVTCRVETRLRYQTRDPEGELVRGNAEGHLELWQHWTLAGSDPLLLLVEPLPAPLEDAPVEVPTGEAEPGR